MVGGVTGRRWPWFGAWGLVGVCVGLSLSALALVTLPLAVVLAFVFRRRSYGRERLGLAAGIGVAVAFFGSLHTSYQACSSAPFVGRGGVVYSCGGVDGPRWLILGTAAVVAAVAVYWYAAYRASALTTTSALPIRD